MENSPICWNSSMQTTSYILRFDAICRGRYAFDGTLCEQYGIV